MIGIIGEKLLLLALIFTRIGMIFTLSGLIFALFGLILVGINVLIG